MSVPLGTSGPVLEKSEITRKLHDLASPLLGYQMFSFPRDLLMALWSDSYVDPNSPSPHIIIVLDNFFYVLYIYFIVLSVISHFFF